MSEVSLLHGSKGACVSLFSAVSLLSRTWLARVGAGVLLGAEVDILIRQPLFAKIHLPPTTHTHTPPSPSLSFHGSSFDKQLPCVSYMYRYLRTPPPLISEN